MRSVIEGLYSDYEPKAMHQIFEERLNDKCINRPALYYHDMVDGVRETSFDELNKKANRLGACIAEIVRDSDAKRNQDDDYVIAVCMNTNDNVIGILLAVWKSQMAYLPLEPSFPPSRIQHIVGEARPALVICDDDTDQSVFKDTHSISYTELLIRSSNCSEENIHTEKSVSCDEDDVAIILYTSGSTGLPKGVRIPHSAVLNKLRWLEVTFPYSLSEDVAALNSALINVDSVAEIWCPLLNGVAVLVIPPEVTKDPSRLVDLLEFYKVERLVLVPTLLTSILAYLSLQNERSLSSIKTWICCGETLTTSLAEKFFKNFSDGTNRLCNFYGSTEDMGDVTYYMCESMEQLVGLTKVPIGQPLINTIIYILDDDLNPVKFGEIGEIYVAGLNLAKGYVAGREKSKFIHNRFIDNPKFNRFYRTGDFGKLINDACIQYEGRTDSQIKVRGNRVEILEIERALRSIEEVDKGIVLCYHAGKDDQAVLAFVVLSNVVDESSSQQGNAIESVLRTKLRDFEMPHVFVVNSIPLLPNGKIDRQTLLTNYETRNEKRNTAFNLTGLPADSIETARRVFEIVGNVIGSSTRATISVQSNFYELGGNSLNSVLAVTQLRDNGFIIGVTDFITAKCLGDVVHKIVEGRKVEESVTQFTVTPLQMQHKQQVIEIMTTSFYDKSDLGAYLMDISHPNDQKEFIELAWEQLLEFDVSFVLTDHDDDVVGFSINQDGQDQMKLVWNSSLSYIYYFLVSIERPVLEKILPQGKNKVFHNVIVATSGKLTPQQNIEAIQKMEEENVNVARRKGFIGILSTNTSLLTQQLGNGIYGYQTLVDYQINEYVDHRDGSRPFGKAPDSQRVLVHWKYIN